MVVLEDRGVIVEDGELTAAVTEVGTVTTGMVHIVYYGSYQADDAVQSVQVVGDVLLLQEVGGGLKHVCRVAGVVVAVGTVVVGLYQGQPVLEDVVLHLQSF